MGLLDEVGVVGIIPFAEQLFGKVVRFLTNEYEHFLGAGVHQF